MKNHAMQTRTTREFRSITRDKDGKPVVADRKEVVVVTLQTTGERGDRRVFFQGARVA